MNYRACVVAGAVWAASLSAQAQVFTGIGGSWSGISRTSGGVDRFDECVSRWEHQYGAGARVIANESTGSFVDLDQTPCGPRGESGLIRPNNLRVDLTSTLEDQFVYCNFNVQASVQAWGLSGFGLTPDTWTSVSGQGYTNVRIGQWARVTRVDGMTVSNWRMATQDVDVTVIRPDGGRGISTGTILSPGVLQFQARFAGSRGRGSDNYVMSGWVGAWFRVWATPVNPPPCGSGGPCGDVNSDFQFDVRDLLDWHASPVDTNGDGVLESEPCGADARWLGEMLVAVDPASDADGNGFPDVYDSLVGGVCMAACACDENADTVVDILDALVFLEGYFGASASVDRTGDGIVDVLDLLTFLECWFPAANGMPCGAGG